MPTVCRLCSANVTKVKRFATRTDLSELKAACETYIIEHFEEMSREEHFYIDATPSEMDHYLSLDELGVWNEDTVLHSIDNWASLRGLYGQDDAIEFARHLRVDRLSEDCVNNAVSWGSVTKPFLPSR